MAIDAIFERLAFEDVLERDRALLRALAFDRDGPRLTRSEASVRFCAGSDLPRPELVEVVVRGQVLPGVGRLGRAQWARAPSISLRPCVRGLLRAAPRDRTRRRHPRRQARTR